MPESSSLLDVAILRHTLFLHSEQFIPLQAEALRANVTLIARDTIVDAWPGLTARSLVEGRPGAAYRHMLGDSRPLVELLREVTPDVVHAHFGVEGMYSIRAAQSLDLPHFTTFHGFDATRSERSLALSGSPSWLRLAQGRRRFLTSGTHLIAVSHHLKRRLVDLGANPDAVSVIGTGVDVSAIRPTPLPDSPIVLHVARLVEKKGTDYLLQAFAVVMRRVPEARLRIIGDGPLRPLLERRATELGICKSVTFEGSLPHQRVIEALCDSTLLCLPSVTATSGDQEGLGQVLLEAGAAARPVIATDHGGIPEAVIDDHTGYLVPERDVNRLAERLIAVLQDSSLASAFGKQGQAYVRREFDVSAQAEKVVQAYESARGL